MKVRLHGTRGSVGRAGPGTVRYGGDTSSVEVTADDGRALILDAGSGVVHAECSSQQSGRIDVLLTHLHMDHIQGLGFFGPLFSPDVAVHLWGPISSTSLAARLSRYLSPPLFPVRLRDLPAVTVHDLSPGPVDLGPFRISADFVIHPGQTYGYRIDSSGGAVTYIPDHEPALGHGEIPGDPRWTSGFSLAEDTDLLIHDAQYTDEQYDDRVGWGHSTLSQALDFAALTNARRLVTFHHEPNHTDEEIDRIYAEERDKRGASVVFEPGLANSLFAI